ncbi:glucose-1-phosphate adenylyltransferase large subunit 1-like [Papaver somniferum]|uniref:glucose-1-phosphate adenylyltransferase large subunit 1-like n=1 Tax=Papaver somniferum TaxID=3469 RepID=UPI000E704193|nr:glucose-1-phosphate adenylyltransferase large subunit 1-like [Papaver somniferum]
MGLTASKVVSFPMEQNLRLKPTDGEPLSDPTPYRRLIGRLLYLKVTRPDITYVVNILSQFMQNPRTAHHAAALRILRYLKGTIGHGILLSVKSSLHLRDCTDSDYADFQPLVAQQWDLHIPVSEPFALYCDSQAAIIAENLVFHERTKHIKIDCYFVREKIQTLQANAHLVKVGKGGGVDNGFWGERVRGNLMNSKKDLKKSSFLRSEFGKWTRIKANGGIGVVSSVHTSDHVTKEAMTHPGPVLPYKIADPNSVTSVILGGGYEIDTSVPISNCINSGINKIFILTQLTYAILNRDPILRKHVHRFKTGIGLEDGCIELQAATQTQENIGQKWFRGTTDALRLIARDAKNKNIEHIMILSGDHLYRMDYMDFVQKHIDTGADISIPCISVDDSLASDYGLMKVDSSGRVIRFAEKPKGADLKAMQVDTAVLGLSPEQAIRSPYIASIGIYLFRTDVLIKLLMPTLPISVDFGSEILPSAVMDHNAQAIIILK